MLLKKEVSNLQQRSKEGIQTAGLTGKQIVQKQGNILTTKKSMDSKPIIPKHSNGFNGTLDDGEVLMLTVYPEIPTTNTNMTTP